MYEFEEIMKNEFLKFNNKKVKEETLNEYLASLKNEELTRFAITQVFVDKDYYNLFKVKNLNNRAKKYIIDYIMDNLDKILESYIKIIRTHELEQLKTVIKNNNKKLIFGSLPISIHFINILKNFSLAKVEYNDKDDSLKIFMPNEYIDIFNSCIKNKKLLEVNKFNNQVYDYAETVINTYGIVTLDKLHELFENQMFKIDKDELQHIIASIAIYEEMYIYEYNGEMLLCNLEFADEDFALDFYDNQKMDYKKYSKEDYKKISNCTYVEKLKSYKKFINYLCKNYEGISEDIEYINEFIVYDYINFAQISIEDADHAFRTNIVKILETDDKELEDLLKLMKNIFNEYPKWYKRGNI